MIRGATHPCSSILMPPLPIPFLHPAHSSPPFLPLWSYETGSVLVLPAVFVDMSFVGP